MNIEERLMNRNDLKKYKILFNTITIILLFFVLAVTTCVFIYDISSVYVLLLSSLTLTFYLVFKKFIKKQEDCS